MAGTLVDYLEIQNESLKLNKELIKSKTASNNQGENQIDFSSNPLVRRVSPHQKIKARAYNRTGDYPKRNHVQENKPIINST